MREGWNISLLNDVCEKITDGSHYSPKTSPDYKYPYITVRDIQEDKIDFHKCKFVGEKDYQDLVKNGCKPVKGDLLFSKDGTVGKVSLVNYEKEFVVLSSLAIIRPDKHLIDSEFLKYILIDPRFLYQAVKKKTGVAIRRIVLKNLKKIEISYPTSLLEQKAIVKILDEAFAKIDQAKGHIEKNIENAKELFRSRKEKLFEELSTISKTLSIPEICDEIFAGGDAPKNNMSKEKTEKYNVPIIANAVKENGLYGYTTEARVLKPSITIAARGSGTGHTEIRNYPFLPIVRLIVLTPKTDIVNLDFLRHAILNLVITSSGSAIPQLTIPMIKTYNLPIPDLSKQESVVNELSDLKKSLDLFKQKSEKKLNSLEELKKSLLQKAFSGELV
jgi:type I restriction enzyme S subunit